MSLAISTSWNAYRHNCGEKMLFEISGLGFKAVELSFNLDAGMVKGIASCAGRFNIAVTSLHNYCPIPDGLSRQEALPDCFSLSSLDEDERRAAVEQTKRTIDTAVMLGAKAVVLHCGRVEMPDYTRQLIGLYEQGLISSPEARHLKEDMLRLRGQIAGDFVSRVLFSLDELNSYAGITGITLGVETRFYHREIPDIDEIGLILDKFSGSRIGYWHDTGHAQLMENLGFLKHEDFLRRYGGKLVGTHLHDISGCRDHLAPLDGKIDFNMLKPYLGKGVLKVIEAHQPAAPEALIRSRDFISGLYDEPA
jgi:sugar phosphate isomerase/epimerase